MSPEHILIRPDQPEERESDWSVGVLNIAPVLFNVVGRDGIQNNNPRFEIIHKSADKNIKLSLI